MNSVFIDTNMVNEDGSYYISEIIVRKRGHKVGDIVTAYQDNEAWKARIVKNGETWGVAFLSEAQLISNDRYEGHREGFAEGVYIQSLRTIRILQNLNTPDDLIENLKHELDLI